MIIYLATARNRTAPSARSGGHGGCPGASGGARSAAYPERADGLMKELGYGSGYQYAHDAPEAYIPQEYLPDPLRGSKFYEPGPFAFEKEIAKRLAWWRIFGGARARVRRMANRHHKTRSNRNEENAWTGDRDGSGHSRDGLLDTRTAGVRRSGRDVEGRQGRWRRLNGGNLDVVLNVYNPTAIVSMQRG